MTDITLTVSDEKLQDAETPGFEVSMDPDEAMWAGAFHEGALTEVEARESSIDLVEVAHG